MLMLMLVAKMAGEQAILGIAEWVRLRIDGLAQIVPLQAGPCANTYTNIYARIDAVELSAKWRTSSVLRLLYAQHTQHTQCQTPQMHHHCRYLACDGKVLRVNHRGGAEAWLS